MNIAPTHASQLASPSPVLAETRKATMDGLTLINYQCVVILNPMKALKFVGNSRNDLSDFPDEARNVAGFELWQVQLGYMPSDFKPMPTVGVGAYEVRIKVGGSGA